MARGEIGGLLIFLAAAATTAWVRPYSPSGAKPAASDGEKLDYVLLEVNGETKLVRDGDELKLVFGDTFKVKDAKLRDASRSATAVDVVGYGKSAARNAAEERGLDIDTGFKLSPKQSEDGKGEVYAVSVTSDKQLHGVVYVRLLPPVLQYAEVAINGAPRTMRDGEELTVKRADKVKVRRVVTNLASDDGVSFQIVALPGTPGAHEIRFVRAGKAFAAIPLKVAD